MQSKVNIIADDMGNVIRQSSTSSELETTFKEGLSRQTRIVRQNLLEK